jgi:hypothetical protein
MAICGTSSNSKAAVAAYLRSINAPLWRAPLLPSPTTGKKNQFFLVLVRGAAAAGTVYPRPNARAFRARLRHTTDKATNARRAHSWRLHLLSFEGPFTPFKFQAGHGNAAASRATFDLPSVDALPAKYEPMLFDCRCHHE